MTVEIQTYLPEIKQVLQNHLIEEAYLFGSAASGKMHDKSDVDLLVRFVPGLDYETYADNYFDLLHTLQDLLKKDVDLVAEETVTNPYLLQHINLHKIKLI